MTAPALTRYDLVVLQWVCEGRTNAWIARQQCTAEHVANHQVDRLLAAFKARNRTHLAALAVAAGLATPDSTTQLNSVL